MMEGYTLTCPVRGPLSNTGRSSDGLTQNEEYQRVAAIRFLISLGYPKDRFRVEVVQKKFGNNGRNSFRCDFVVLDGPECNISHDPDDVLSHAVLLCEVKRDSSKQEWVKQTQVEPMLDFAKRTDAVALYWSKDVVRVLWHEIVDGVTETREAPVSALPKYGEKVDVKPLTFSTIHPCPSLVSVFSKIEDVLYNAGLSKEKRYEAIFQLLLAKLFDEHAFETRPDARLEMQDFAALGYSAKNATAGVAAVVKKAVNFYQTHLPNKIPTAMTMPESATLDVMKILAPFKIIASSRDVVQTFYMKFAKDLYKWDMAQYFTPTAISDFVVEIANPQFGELTCDPACGSADFLVGTFRFGKRYNPGYADSVYGYDNSPNAVQVAVLNMVLNGDGKSNIHKQDTLAGIKDIQHKYDLVICNPPFGSKIAETRRDVLSMFDLRHALSIDEDNGTLKTGDVLDKQETGILFVEACVKLCREEGGRIAIVLPNGYLGNNSAKFLMFREWLLRNASIAAVIALPRFAFKSSGADVSASIVFMETLPYPTKHVESIRNKAIGFEIINKLGWSAGDKRQAPTYVRNQENGTLVIGSDGQPEIDSDYGNVLSDLLNSQAAMDHPWLLEGRREQYTDGSGWSISGNRIIADPNHSLDPKYYSRKNIEHLSMLENRPHVVFGDIATILEEKKYLDGTRFTIDPSKTYRYADISHIANGSFSALSMRGWELPDRARHPAQKGDLFFGSIWGSVRKWCLIPEGEDNLIVTNGCMRAHLKDGCEKYLVDVISYMTTESWGAQMRAIATGSDGLAEISADSVKNMLIPLLDDRSRKALEPYAQRMLQGRSSLADELASLEEKGMLKPIDIKPRYSHINLV